MNMSLAYIIIAIVALTIIAIVMFLRRKDRQESRLSPLAGLAFAFVLAGILFGDDRFIGYGLMGIGVLLAVVDIFLSRAKNDGHT